MYQNIFDTHAHYDDQRFDEDRHVLLSSLPASGVRLVLNAACDMASCVSSMDLARRYPFVYASVGVHPHAAQEVFGTASYLEQLASWSKDSKVRAIGEIGLDYHYDFSPREKQKAVFAQQLQLAKDLDLPVIIHSREALADTLELLKHYRPKGIVHCYTGSAEMVPEFLRLGLYIGFTGSVTFKNANKILKAAAAVPLERLLVETDCPYMSPEPFRGKRNDSSHLPWIGEKLAALHQIDPQSLFDLTFLNGCQVYGVEG